MIESAKIKTRRRSIPEMVRNYILKRDGRECVQCGSKEDLVIDHIKPFSKNGETEIDNLQTMCSRCNMDKGNGGNESEPPLSIAGAKGRIFSGCFSLKEEAERAAKKVEKMCIRIALHELKWNRRKVTRVLGISYRSLLYKIKEYKLIE